MLPKENVISTHPYFPLVQNIRSFTHPDTDILAFVIPLEKKIVVLIGKLNQKLCKINIF